jgi:RHS repeat-associated protein
VCEYHYKDHLGNLRLAYREGKEATPWKATMDAVNAPTEEREFANLTLTRDASKKRGATGESCRVNTAENKPIGAWKSIPVTQGDKVKAKVFSHYVANANNNNASSLFLALGGNALAYGSQTLPTGETKLPPSPFTNLTVGLSSLLTQNPSSTSLPKAYLAIIQYNENNQIVGQAQISYVTTASLSTTWQEHHAEFTATTNGRIEVFVANESNTNVWFDDLEVALTGTMIVQETHYDPWGMELVGIGKKGDNRFKFMGKETESNFDLNWIETDWRGYDAQLGRFHQVDKLAENMMDWTAYHYAFNNPIRLNDPSGLMPEWLQEIWDNSKSGDNWVNDNNGGFVKTNQNSQKKAEPKAQSLTVKKLREIASQNGVTDLLQIGAVFEQAFIEASKGYVRYNDKPNEDNDYTIIEFENNVRTAKVRPDGLGPTATRQGMGYINLVQNSAFYEIKSGYTLLDANYSQDNPKQLLAMLDALSQSEAHQYGNATLFLVTPVGVVVDLTTEAKRYGVNLIQITPTLLDDGKISFNKATFHYVVPNRGAIKAELSMKAFSTPVELKW